MGTTHSHKTVACSMATDTSVTTAVDCRGWNHVSLECPTFAIGMLAATAIAYCKVCATSDGTYRPLYDVGDGTTNIVKEWATVAGTGNFIVPVAPFKGYSYVKFHFNATASAASFNPVVHFTQ